MWCPMGVSIRIAGRGALAAAVVTGLACLGTACPAVASSHTVPGQVMAARAGGPTVPGFAPRNFPPARDSLRSISCPSGSFCMALGGDTKGSLAEVWNGRSWRVTLRPPGGASQVSCTSVRFCMTLGGTFERWNGRSWTATRTPRALSGPSGLACVSASFCMAVGLSNDISPDGNDGCVTGAVWRGTAWHTVAMHIDGCAVGDYSVGPVSCASASDCIAVGFQDGNEHMEVGLVERWNGTTWQDLGAPNVPGGGESHLTGVSCPSTSFCMADGYFSESDFGSGNLAYTWDGTGWTQVSPPPSPVGSVSGLSCASAGSCVAFSGGQPITWNGTTWTAQTISRPAGAGLSGVSCWPSACMAVGSYSRIAPPGTQPGGQAGAHLTLAESWNGSTWQALRTPSLGDEQEGLSGLSCRSASNCMAVGAFVNNADVQAALTEQWNGHAWKVLSAPDPGPNENVLTAVSCPAATQCIAVGYYDAAGSLQALAERWNGGIWTTLAVPHGGVLNGVSCATANDCVAVGSYLPPGRPVPLTLSATWDGSTWTVQPSPDPGGAPAQLTSVACPNSTRCIAVGDYQPGPGLVHPLTALWNGTAWTRLTTQAPGGANGWNTLTSVSCPRPSNCTAVGTTFHLPGRPYHPQALAESWNGTRWTARPTPALKDKFKAYLDAVSCPATTRCRAAGGYLTAQGNGFVLAEAWNGATWRRLLPLTDPSPVFNGLYAISCPATYRCIAVGGTEIQHTLAYLWNGTRWRRLNTRNP